MNITSEYERISKDTKNKLKQREKMTIKNNKLKIEVCSL